METRKQGLTFISATLALVATLVIIQLWLLSVTIEALRGGDASTAVATAIAQVALFCLNGGILLHVLALDRRLRRLAGRKDG